MSNTSKTNTARKLTSGIITIIILAVCLAITTFALVYASVNLDNNVFKTGDVNININDGKQIIQEDEFIFEPGMTVEKSFFIKNESSWEVYYRLYLDDVKGGLANVLDLTIKDKDSGEVLYSGKVSELTRENVVAADDTLATNERRDLTAVFHYPEISGNETQNLSLEFTMCAEASQTKNNPDKLFD